MLIRLSITNLATIESLSVSFREGFTVLTGETGAGKSILVDAIRFVLGAKSAPDQVRSGEKHTLVEAVFDLGALPAVRERLGEMEIPAGEELVLRRVLQENGRSRAVANDCSITQTRLEELGAFLVDIHGQHDNQMLLNPATHVDFLDAFGGLLTLRGEVAAAHEEYSALLRERRELREETENRQQRRDELVEMLEELRGANISQGEEEALRTEHALLSNAERLTGLLGSACGTLYEGEGSILELLGQVGTLVGEAARVDGRLATQSEIPPTLRVQVEDLYRFLRAHAAGLEDDPNRLEGVNARLAELEKIKRKYDGDLAEALRFLNEGEAELATLEEAGETLSEMDAKVGRVAAHLHALSNKLSRERKAKSSELGRQISAQLVELGMEKAVFDTRIEELQSGGNKSPSYSKQGMDKVEFLLSTNPGQAARSLSRIASGGELSRTMLALKTVLTEADPTHTLIFDEVDAGISGNIAEIVGHKLRGLGESHQVLCVTHLPQIAALGEGHVLVTKSTRDDQTFTRAEILNREEKVSEVARLLSGVSITDRSLASAEEMVERGSAPG